MYTKYKVSNLTLCQGKVCTDDDANANDANTDANDGQSLTVQSSLVDKPNEPKILGVKDRPVL